MSRQITTHKVNGLNDALAINVLDEPGAGGACHEYRIVLESNTNVNCRISFQNGPIKESGYNGISGEALLAVVRDRLECFQAGPYAATDNQEALDHIVAAMEALHRRTKERVSRGVEGTHSK